VSGDEIEAASAKPRRSGVWATVHSVLKEGGPGFSQFALTNVCNANCAFCNFARDRLPKRQWHSVERQGAFDARRRA
jgi:hypothetical protein